MGHSGCLYLLAIVNNVALNMGIQIPNHSCYNISLFPSAYVRVLISPHPPQLLLFSVFWIISILVDIKWYFIVVLVYIFLITPDVTSVNVLIAHFISSLKKCPFKSFSHLGYSLWSDKNILEFIGGDGCTSLWMCQQPLNCTHKNNKK